MSSHRLKVLHCLGSMNRGGVENWLIQVLQYLDLSQFEIEICCLDANGDLGVLAPTVEALGVRIFACPLTRDPALCCGPSISDCTLCLGE